MSSRRALRHALKALLVFVLLWAPAAAASVPCVEATTLIAEHRVARSTHAQVSERDQGAAASAFKAGLTPASRHGRTQSRAQRERREGKRPPRPLYLLHLALLR